jgi:hypothetical protein
MLSHMQGRTRTIFQGYEATFRSLGWFGFHFMKQKLKNEQLRVN